MHPTGCGDVVNMKGFDQLWDIGSLSSLTSLLPKDLISGREVEARYLIKDKYVTLSLDSNVTVSSSNLQFQLLNFSFY